MLKKLLVVDDEKSITTILAKIARGVGYDVEVLNDPSAALDRFAAFKPDVVMLDLVMPEIDGIDILRKILAAGTAAKIVVMTGFGLGYLRLARAVAEFDHHPSFEELTKPFRRVDVLTMLNGGPPFAASGTGHPDGDRAAA